MQLESSVFGVCVIQLKPQLERRLELPEGALTKEIQLTQDLMSLFLLTTRFRVIFYRLTVRPTLMFQAK
jgi:hypothetical protein